MTKYDLDPDVPVSQLNRLADFLNEVGMLRHTPRSGYAFLGSGKENVAEHSYRTSVIGFVLASLCNCDAAKVTLLCLFHDLHEARTGDFNYVNHRYNTCNAIQALTDATAGTGLQQTILDFWNELENRTSQEAILAHDADQLDMIINLRMELARGNEFAAEWLDSALLRLKSPIGRELAEAILKTDPNAWWYGNIDKDWWVRRGK